MTRRQKTVLVPALAVLGVGLFILLLGVSASSNQANASYSAGQPLLACGWILVLSGLFTAAGIITCAIFRFFTAELRRYQAWKASLTPQERLLVNLAEATAIIGGSAALHEKMHARNVADAARHTASVMGQPYPHG